MSQYSDEELKKFTSPMRIFLFLSFVLVGSVIATVYDVNHPHKKNVEDEVLELISHIAKSCESIRIVDSEMENPNMTIDALADYKTLRKMHINHMNDKQALLKEKIPEASLSLHSEIMALDMSRLSCS